MFDLPIRDSYQKKLEKNIYKNYDYFLDKKVNINNLYKYKKKYEEFIKTKTIDERLKNFPLTLYEIKNDKVNISKKFNSIIDKKDLRYKSFLIMFNNTINWAKKNNLRIPKVNIYFWINDNMPYLSNHLDNFPLWVMSKPNDTNYILSPNEAFSCFQMDKRNYGKCYNWDEVKKVINKQCKHKNKKKKYVYFKGMDTTSFESNLRKNLEDTQKQIAIPLKIDLEVKKSYIPIYDLCNYKILLDLPGRGPWSIRTQMLPLMKSNIIRVKLEKITEEYHDKSFITFADYILKSTDYISIKYNYYHKDKVRNEKEFKKFSNKLVNVYHDIEKNKDEKYSKMVDRAYSKMNKLTNERIYQCVYLMLLLQEKISVQEN